MVEQGRETNKRDRAGTSEASSSTSQMAALGIRTSRPNLDRSAGGSSLTRVRSLANPLLLLSASKRCFAELSLHVGGKRCFEVVGGGMSVGAPRALAKSTATGGNGL